MKTKTFDAVEMKRRGAERIYEQLKGKSIGEQVAFWHEKDREFQEERAARRAGHQAFRAATAEHTGDPGPLHRADDSAQRHGDIAAFSPPEVAAKAKTFDCVEMKRRGAERIYQELKDLTPEEQVAYWKRKDEEFRRSVEALRTRRKAS